METLQTRSVTDLKAVAGDLVESLLCAFPKCPEMETLCQQLSSGLDLEDDAFDEFLRHMTSILLTTVPYKTVKYDRAILSITGSPLNVYQVIMYKDLDTLSVVFSKIRKLDMVEKLKSLSTKDCSLFWSFLHDAVHLTLRAAHTIPPAVPTPDQISENIEKRRRQRDQINETPEQRTNMSVADGVDDLWKELCHTRNVTPVNVDTELAGRITRHMTATVTEDGMISNFPELGTSRYTDESIAITHRIGSLSVLRSKIPQGMMSGIERVASSLIRDINSGKLDFSSLDVEKIGEQVLHGVDEQDVTEFSENLNNILPALQSMRNKR